MSYSNINNPVNYQLQGFGQNGVRTISTDQLYIQGEYYRVLVAEEDSYVTAVSVLGDDLTAEFVYAGTTIYGLFTEVSVTSGSLTAYIAGPTDIEDVWAYINEYGLTNAATIEAADCAKDAIAPLLDKYYAKASLVMVPSLYKTSIVYSERPLTTSGQLAFTRSNDTATRVGPDGYIEKVRTNLILQSNTFNTTWATTNASVTSGQGGYDGSNDAWLVSNTATNGYLQQTNSLSASIYTYSVYVKKGSGLDTTFRMRIQGAANNTIEVDIVSGTLSFSLGNVISTSIDNVGGGWFRIQYSVNDSVSYVRLEIRGDNTNSIYIQNAQLESGDIATQPILTTTTAVSVGPVANLPRLNYPINSDGSVGCPSLLLEPQRTNLVTFSEQFNNAAWSKVVATITANYATSPDGYMNADRIVFGTNGYMTQGFSGTYTASIYVKGTAGETIRFGVGSNVAQGALFTFTGEWQRIVHVGTVSTSLILLSTFSGATATDFLIWGAQLEAGAYATSYIPTLGASVTRGADACSKTGVSSLIGQTQGTIFLDIKYLSTGSTASGRWFKVFGTSNEIALAINGLDYIRSIVNNQSDTITTSPKSNTGIKIAWAYSASGVVLFVNGVEHALPNGSSQVISSLDSILFDASANGNFAEGNIYQALLFKTRLTNQELQDLTTL